MQKRFHHYYLTEQLASKPLRSAYLAHHMSDASEPVVLKIFHPTCLNTNQNSQSLLQKVEWIKQFKHVHIVPILDLGIEQGQPYVVSRYLSSGSLRHRLDHLSSQRLDLQEALAIIFQMGRALRYAHQQNIFHGNIKPENIFFDEQGKALLTDFHLAGFIDTTKFDSTSDSHTTSYLAPEQCSGSITEKSDQYALACLAYKLMTGCMPFSGQGFSSTWTKEHRHSAVPLSDLAPDLPEQTEEILLKALSKDPSDRYANVSIFIRALEAVSLLPTPVSTLVSRNSPLATPPSKTLMTTMKEPVEVQESVTPLAIRLSEALFTARLLESSTHGNKEQDAGKTLARLAGEAHIEAHPKDVYPETLPKASLFDPPSRPGLLDSPSRAGLLDSPSRAGLLDSPSRAGLLDSASRPSLLGSSSRPGLLDSPSRAGFLDSASRPSLLDSPSRAGFPHSPLKTSLLDSASRPRLLDAPSQVSFPQSRKPLTPTLWLAFALSGIVILMGAIIPYALVPLHSPGSGNLIKNSSTVVDTTNPVIHATPILPPTQLPPTIQTHLTGNYAEQTGIVYNLTNEGTLDWIQWGLNAPEDVNHKLNVQQQISNFALIGYGTAQRDDHYANAYTWSDGTPVRVAPSQQQSGVYVRGIGNGFTMTIPASTTPRILRVYVGAAHAQAKFTASINERTFIDTTLDMRNDPNIEDNGIYTLTFSSSTPNQVLTVKYTVRSSDAANGYVMLEAATLQD